MVDNKTLNDNEPEKSEEQAAGFTDEQRCKQTTSRWPLIFSLLAVIVAAVFGFGISSNIMGVDKQLAQEMKTVALLEQKVQQLEGLVKQVGTAEMVRNELNSAAADEVLRRVAALKEGVTDDALVTTLDEVEASLQKVKAAFDAKRLAPPVEK
ncbi:hypothetical protein [Oleidesulfovibrio sp.]|uniref:hypothetical protein n=1 Tax=Oleidesulfovibrio sp. TaxID=2909707 RepID=UPI003A8A2468